MIYNTRNLSNDTTESQKEKKDLFHCKCRRKVKLDCTVHSNQTNKMWSLKCLVILKCESRTSLHAVQLLVNCWSRNDRAQIVPEMYFQFR